VRVQPVTISVQLLEEEPMQEPESIAANWTHESGNCPCESSKDKAPAVVRRGPAEERASHQAITLRNRCSAVNNTTRTGFKWRVEVAEPLLTGRRLNLQASRVNAPGETSGVGAMAWWQGLGCKTGIVHASGYHHWNVESQQWWLSMDWRMRP
jgi:hypothetical protein